MSDSVRACDLARRVAGYDSDMEIMHPLRSKMAEALLDFSIGRKLSDPIRNRVRYEKWLKGLTSACRVFAC